MSSSEDPAAVEAIRRTIARYSQLCDDGRFDEFVELFEEDADFAVMGQVFTGREAIGGFLAAAQTADTRGKHLTSNTVISFDGGDADQARVWTDYVFVARGEGRSFAVASVGRYHDVVRRDPASGAWRFARREIVFLGDDPA